MRVLMVSEDIPASQLGGLGKHAVRLANALLDEGHEVVLMGRSDVDYEACRAETGFNGRFIGGFHFHRAGWKERSFGVFMPYKRPALARRIARAILKHAPDYDVVHYHGHLPLVGRYIPATVNFVQTRHDQGSECLMHVRLRHGQPCHETSAWACAGCATASPNWLQRVASAAAVRQHRYQTAEAFGRHSTIFVSEFLRNRFLQVVPDSPAGKGTVIHNFVEKGIALAARPAVQNMSRPRLIIVGRIDEAKGVRQLLEALASRPEVPFDLQIVGDGPQRALVEAEFKARWLTFLGWKSPDDTGQLMRLADHVVLPTVCEEACPTVVLEGLALGKPVSALARGGTPELRRYEIWEGQLALYDDIAGLAEALVRRRREAPLQWREFRGDVQAQLPRIKDVYLERGIALASKECLP